MRVMFIVFLQIFWFGYYFARVGRGAGGFA
jgi:hypothetical protein